MEYGWEAGDQAIDDNEKKKKEAQEGRLYRFYLRAKDETKIIFLDDLPPILWEHQFNINGDWKNWFTCIQGINGQSCPGCARQAPARVAGFLIIDRTEWNSEKTGLHVDEPKLFACKMTTLRQLKVLKTRREGLAGCEFFVNRTSNETANVGDNFDFVRKWDPKELMEAFGAKVQKVMQLDHYPQSLPGQPTDDFRTFYDKHFAAITIDEFNRRLGGAAPVQQDGQSAPGGDQGQGQGGVPYNADEDIPF